MTPVPIWVALGVGNRPSVTFLDATSGEDPQCWRGNDLEIHCAVFDATGAIVNLNNAAHVAANLYAAPDSSLSPLMPPVELDSTDIEPAIDIDDWKARTDQQFTLAIPASSTMQEMTSRHVGKFWLTIKILTEAGDAITTGGGWLRIFDDGTQSGTVPPVPPSEYYTKTQIDALFSTTVQDPTQEVGDIIVRGLDGLERLEIGSEDQLLEVHLGKPAWVTKTVSGDVTGPSGATANHFAAYSDTSGKIIKDSGVSAGDFETPAGADAKVSAHNSSSVAHSDIRQLAADASDEAGVVASDLAAHEADTNNPHSVTKNQVGLGFVDNTTDMQKPVSTAQALALAGKASLTDFNNHVGDHFNPHEVTKAQVGLTYADNTSDADKPISTATQTALDLKVSKDVNGNAESLNSVQYATSPTAPATHTEGRTYWNSVDKTLNVMTEHDGVTVQVGQETLIRVKNVTGSAISNGRAVYATGASAGWITIAPASNDDPVNAEKTIGLTTNDIADGQFGYCTIIGRVRDMDTHAWAAGTSLWLGTNGALTSTEPTYPLSVIRIGVVAVSDATAGVVQVRVLSAQMPTVAKQLGRITGEPTGFEDPSGTGCAYDYTARTITLTHSSGYVKVWWHGTQYTLGTSPWVSEPHDVTAGTWFLSVKSNGAVTWTQTIWDFATEAMIASTYYNPTIPLYLGFKETHGLMPWQSHLEFHERIGAYKRSGGTLTAGTYTLQGSTDAANTPGVDQTVIVDEDLASTLAASLEGSYTRLYFTASGTPNFELAQTGIVRIGTTYPKKNVLSTTWSETELTNGDYANLYLFAVPVTSEAHSQAYRYFWLEPQFSYTSLALAQAESLSSISLGTLGGALPELVALARITIRCQSSYTTTGKFRLEALQYITVGASPSAATPNPAAVAVTFTPAGGIAATNVQAAIEELDAEKSSVVATTLSDDALWRAASARVGIDGIYFDGATANRGLTMSSSAALASLPQWGAVQFVVPTAAYGTAPVILAASSTGGATVAYGQDITIAATTAGDLVFAAYGSSTSNWRKATLANFRSTYSGLGVWLMWSWGVGASAPSLWINGVAQTLTVTTNGTPPDFGASSLVTTVHKFLANWNASTTVTIGYGLGAIGQSDVDMYQTSGRLAFWQRAAASATAKTSGTLVIGQVYYIKTYVAGDSFNNVGAASNASGVQFTATGATPTTWTGGSSLIACGALAVPIVQRSNYTDDASGNGNYGTIVGGTAKVRYDPRTAGLRDLVPYASPCGMLSTADTVYSALQKLEARIDEAAYLLQAGAAELAIPLSYTGTGAGVLTMKLFSDIAQTATIDGAGKFYTDAAGTLNEATSYAMSANAWTIFYIKVPSGTCTMRVPYGYAIRYFGTSANNFVGETANGPKVNNLSTTKIRQGVLSVYASTEQNLSTISGTTYPWANATQVFFIGNSLAVSGTTYPWTSATQVVFIGNSLTISGTTYPWANATQVFFSGNSLAVSGTTYPWTNATQVYFYGNSLAVSGTTCPWTNATLVVFSGGSLTVSGTTYTWINATQVVFSGSSLTVSGTTYPWTNATLVVFSGGSLTVSANLSTSALYAGTSNFDLYINSTGMAVSYPTTRAWPCNISSVYIHPGTGSMVSADVDRILIDIASTANLAAVGSKVIDLGGNCGAHTSASNAAIATLTGLGFTVTVN